MYIHWHGEVKGLTSNRESIGHIGLELRESCVLLMIDHTEVTGCLGSLSLTCPLEISDLHLPEWL